MVHLWNQGKNSTPILRFSTPMWIFLHRLYAQSMPTIEGLIWNFKCEIFNGNRDVTKLYNEHCKIVLTKTVHSLMHIKDSSWLMNNKRCVRHLMRIWTEFYKNSFIIMLKGAVIYNVIILGCGGRGQVNWWQLLTWDFYEYKMSAP